MLSLNFTRPKVTGFVRTIFEDFFVQFCHFMFSLLNRKLRNMDASCNACRGDDVEAVRVPMTGKI